MRSAFASLFTSVAGLVLIDLGLAAEPPKLPREFLPPPFDGYLENRVRELSSEQWLKRVTPENWPGLQKQMRSDLQLMLGLQPWPERTPLNAKITGTLEGDGYVIENLHFQSRPGLYVGANLYRPAKVTQPLPTVLYVCGHSHVVENGVRLGNKTAYQHHGIWFARHGYVCLVLDTIQLGEIEGFHHGTYNLGRWWWPARGYTPAGVEAWNGIRALDYLESRPEVDRTKLGVTGRSGGGAYSWWIAALDDRIKASVPVAGIANLKNHVLDGAIEGHCDCMFMVNTARWDFDRVAALVAPRPLLISNTDKDDIFPLDGVVDVYNRTREVYRRLGKEANIGLHIAEGPHKDMQPLNIGAFHWFERFLKGADLMAVIDEPAKREHPAKKLKVFSDIPEDQRLTTVDEWFVNAANETEAADATAWVRQRQKWMSDLLGMCFAAWPQGSAVATQKTDTRAVEGMRVTTVKFASEVRMPLRMWVLQRESEPPNSGKSAVLRVLDEAEWKTIAPALAAASPDEFDDDVIADRAALKSLESKLEAGQVLALFCPRGVESLGNANERKQTQIRRRLHLLGESLESGQVWDIQAAAIALRTLDGMKELSLALHARGLMAANAVYASLFMDNVAKLDLAGLPSTHRNGPIYLNVLRILDLPQAVTLAAERAPIVLETESPDSWRFPQETSTRLGWGADRLTIRSGAAQQARDPSSR